MNALISQFGLDWKLLLSQLFNFALILIILRAFVYKPLVNLLNKRREKIEQGLAKAKQADVRLKEIDEISKEKIKQAENESINMIKATEKKAKVLEQNFQRKLEEEQIRAQKDLQATYKKQQEGAKELVLKNAVELVRKAIVKTVELKPDAIDDALIKKAASGIRHETE